MSTYIKKIVIVLILFSGTKFNFSQEIGKDILLEQEYKIILIDTTMFKDYNFIRVHSNDENEVFVLKYYILSKKIQKERLELLLYNQIELEVDKVITLKLKHMSNDIKLSAYQMTKPISIIYDYEFITKNDVMKVNFYESPNIIDLYYGELKSEIE